jgi:hypothetical protein
MLLDHQIRVGQRIFYSWLQDRKSSKDESFYDLPWRKEILVFMTCFAEEIIEPGTMEKNR